MGLHSKGRKWMVKWKVYYNTYNFIIKIFYFIEINNVILLQLTAGWFYSIDEWFSLPQELKLEQCKNSVFIKVNGGKENKGDLLKTQVSTNSSRYETSNNIFRQCVYMWNRIFA